MAVYPVEYSGMKVVINPSWKCQLKCPYCWLPHTKVNREAEEHKWREWAEALVRELPGGSTVDISGGEPLLYPGVVDLVSYLGNHGIYWAITTNAMDGDGVETLIAARPPRCAVVNASDHTGNIMAGQHIRRLRTAFPVVVHRVNHPKAGSHIDGAGLIPYQRWAEGEALDGKQRICDAGVKHWVIDPGGDIFRCCVAMQVADKPLGNLFNGHIDKPNYTNLCDFGCSTCYTTEPHAWMIHMEAI